MKLIRVGTEIWIEGTSIRIVATHPDRKRARYWRAQDEGGKPLTPWLPSPTTAALRALRK